MSARPSILQFLQHGKLLCGKVFGGFVETWNYLVEAFDNLKGDAELDPENGIIYVDRSDASHPVIRTKSDRIKAIVNASGGGGGGGGGGGSSTVNVITAAKIGLDIGGDKPRLKLYCKTKPITVAAAGEESDWINTAADDLVVDTLDVVTGSTYSSATHKFENLLQSITVLLDTKDPRANEVFTATAHSAETAQQE